MNRVRRASLPLAALLALPLLSGFTDPADEVARGNERFALGEFERAESHYRSADALAGGPAATRYNLGTARYRKGDYAGAARFFAEAAQGDERDARAPYNLGNALFRMDRLEEAISAYEQALARAPEDADARHNLEQAKRKLRMREQKERSRRQAENQEGEGQEKQDQEGGEGEPRDGEGSEGKEQQAQDGKEGESGEPKEGQGSGESAEERAKVDEAKRRMEETDLSDARMRRYLKNLGEEDQRISERYRRQIVNRRKSEREDPAAMSPEEMMRRMHRDGDPFGRQGDTDEKDW